MGGLLALLAFDEFKVVVCEQQFMLASFISASPRQGQKGVRRGKRRRVDSLIYLFVVLQPIGLILPKNVDTTVPPQSCGTSWEPRHNCRLSADSSSVLNNKAVGYLSNKYLRSADVVN